MAANPFSSSKDRSALHMLRGAEARGELAPGGTVMESTSGNTALRWPPSPPPAATVIIVLPDSAMPERIGLLRALGTEVVQTPSKDGFQGAIAKAEEINARTPGSWYARQHENNDNVLAHYETTGPEIWADTAGTVDVLVVGVGTGATLTGAARYLKEHNPALEVVAVEPASSPVLSRGYGGLHRIPGLNGGFVASTTDRTLIDHVFTCTDEDAMEAAKSLAARQGLFVGVSSGAAVHGAARLARMPTYAGQTIVTVLPDTGERYVSLWNEEATP